MYTWGYIKQACLAKLDMTADQAIEMGLVNKFPFYANEAITQITSAIKPKRSYVDFDVEIESKIVEYCKRMFQLESVTFLFSKNYYPEDMSLNQKKAFEYYHSFEYVGKEVKMPKDFESWNGDRAYINDGWKLRQASDREYNTYGGNKVLFFVPGKFKIPYDARWVIFEPSMDDDFELDVPRDILECLPSYIVSQCYKIDDEQKSSIYRNEYEMALARIEENDTHTNKTIQVDGDW